MSEAKHSKAWSHLPNAKHIDWVLETLEKDTEVWLGVPRIKDAAWYPAWAAVQDAAWGAVKGAAWDAVKDAAWGVAWGAARNSTWNVARYGARGAALNAIAALIAWDNASRLLDMSVEEVTELATQGNQAAVFLLPAVIVKNKLKENK